MRQFPPPAELQGQSATYSPPPPPTTTAPSDNHGSDDDGTAYHHGSDDDGTAYHHGSDDDGSDDDRVDHGPDLSAWTMSDDQHDDVVRPDATGADDARGAARWRLAGLDSAGPVVAARDHEARWLRAVRADHPDQ